MSGTLFDEDEEENNSEDPGEASISSINSDGDKIDSSLIKKILNEMKSEFKKSTPKEEPIIDGNSEEGNDDGDEEDADDFDDDDNDDEDDQKQEEEEEKKRPRNSSGRFEKVFISDLINLESVEDEGEERSRSAALRTNFILEGDDDEEKCSNDDDDFSNGCKVNSSKVMVVEGAEGVDEKYNEEDGDHGNDDCEEFILAGNENILEPSAPSHVPEKNSSITKDDEDKVSSRRIETTVAPAGKTSNENDTCPLRPRKSRTPVVEEEYYDEDDAPRETVVRKRSLRIQSQVKIESNEDSSGTKRSSRRFSKDFNRESVLQNAIARKEKSFSALNSSEERSHRRSSRNQRQNSTDCSKLTPNKLPIKAKTSLKPLAVENKVKPVQATTEETSETHSNPPTGVIENANSTIINIEQIQIETDRKPTPGVFIPTVDTDILESDCSVRYNLSSDLLNSSMDRDGADSNDSSNNKKSLRGNKRKRYFKGLKYSIGRNNVKSSNRTWTMKRQRRSEIEKSTNAKEDDKTLVVDGRGSETNFNGYISENGLKKENETCSEDGENSVSSQRIKRKMDDTKEDFEGKKIKQEVPSPDVGEVVDGPDKPEPAMLSTWNGSNGLCLCSSQDKLYASTASLRSELYCQAIDSLDGRLIGCCNMVESSTPRIVRASVRVPFLVLCNVHHQRLIRHNCCPGCGSFCTQGKFVQCSEGHHYHRDCQATVNNEQVCPHCCTSSAIDVNISLGLHKYPVFLPLQKTPKQVPSAKMTFTQSKTDKEEEEKTKAEDNDDDDEHPLVPASALILPSGGKVTTDGLPQPFEKDKFTLRSMYQAAKSGDAEKMVHILASGLNANHQFREWCMGSALHAACHQGHMAVVHLLLQAGAHTDILDREQNTPLMLAVLNQHNHIVKYLVKAGASVSFKGSEGMTSLHLAAKTGNLEACLHLLSNPNMPRFFIDTVDDGRWTPLVWAAEHCHTDVVRFLLEKRADPLVRDAEQNIALHWAALAGSVEISESLLNYGSEINSTNTHGDTALHIAARQNAYSCVVLLLARGARVDMHNRAGLMPLECCMDTDSAAYKAIKLNIELRAAVNSKSRRPTHILTNDITRGHERNPVQCINAYDDEGIPQDFVYVTENCFTSNITVDRTITSLQSCKCKDTTACTTGCCMCGKISMRCWYDNEGRLLPEFNFADPPMLFECNAACLCNKLTCKNRVVQHGITARFQLFRTKTNKGWGVQTLRLIQKGTYVCEYIGEIISDCEADTREDDSYLFDLDNRDGETYCIDACRYGNIARFINHMCVPNLLPVRVFIDHQDLHFPRIAFFANRDIMANEELGFDYGEKFWIIKYKSFTCTCGSDKCRYSQTTIQQTLENYNRKLQLEESMSH